MTRLYWKHEAAASTTIVLLGKTAIRGGRDSNYHYLVSSLTIRVLLLKDAFMEFFECFVVETVPIV